MATRRIKPASDAQVVLRLSGPGVMPGTVDVRDVAEMLKTFDTLARTAAGIPTDAIAASLLRVKSGSLTLVMGPSAPVERALAETVDHLVSNRLGEMHDGINKPLRSLIERAEQKNRKLSLSAGGQTADLTGRNRPTPTPANLAPPLRGTTTLYGVVMAARLKANSDGGDVSIKATDTQRQIPVECDASRAVELGAHLGREVGLDGEAEWTGPLLELTSFKATSVIPFEGTRDVAEWIEGLRRFGPISVHDDGDDGDDEEIEGAHP